MENTERISASSPSVFTPPMKTLGTPVQPSSIQRISTMRPLATAYKASTSDYQVFKVHIEGVLLPFNIRCKKQMSSKQ